MLAKTGVWRGLSFRIKLFLALFFSSSLICSFVLSLSYIHATDAARIQFEYKYQNLINLIGNSILDNERNAEESMRNAAIAIRNLNPTGPIFSTDKLKELREELALTHIFIIDHSGKFIRSTNEDPNLIPNIFSFCSDYKELYSKLNGVEATPVIPPSPEPNPYKFLTIPSADKNYLIHVAKRVDFIGRLLGSMMKRDESILQIEMFAPNGTSLGSFDREGVDLSRFSDPSITNVSDGVTNKGTQVVFNNWIDSAHVNCCQCKTFKNTKNGQYQYFLRTKVATKQLDVVYGELLYVFLAGELLAIGLSLFLASLTSKKIVSRLEYLKDQIVKTDADSGKLMQFEVSGNDEISILGQSFNALLKKVSNSTEKIVELEKKKIISELAARLAHDIRSPLSAIRIVLENPPVDGDRLKLIKIAFERVNVLTTNLLSKYRGDYSVNFERIDVVEIIDQIVDEAMISENGKCEFQKDYESLGLIYVLGEPSEIGRAVFNIIQNAVQAIEITGIVKIGIQEDSREVNIIIEDNGKGIPNVVLSKLGQQKITFDKSDGISKGTGLGFISATEIVQRMGGTIRITSEERAGTSVKIVLPKATTSHT